MHISAESIDSAVVGQPLNSQVAPEFEYRLSHMAMNPRSGCQAKASGSQLHDMLVAANEAVPGVAKVDPSRPQDCASVDIGTSGKSLLATTDMQPMVGPNMKTAGSIVALHAASDIYASGGVPRWALANVILSGDYDDAAGVAILAGLWEACKNEGISIVGGQTIVGMEPMAGLTVFGFPHGDRALSKRGARTGDVLLLSKPLGVGLIVRAYKLRLVGEKALELANHVMLTSNRAASRIMLEAGVRAATDVTGFGMLGHLTEMLEPGQGACVHFDAVPILAPVTQLPPGISRTPWVLGNRDYVEEIKTLHYDRHHEVMAPLFDPQTNGGLLVAAAPERAAELVAQGFTRLGTIDESDAVTIE